MNNLNVHFHPWSGGCFGSTPGSRLDAGASFFRPPFGFGGGLANAWLHHSSQSMSHGWGAYGHSGGWGGGWGRGRGGCEAADRRGPGGHGGHGRCGAFGPHEGRWNADKGSYTMGSSGRLEVQVGETDAAFNSRMQYRVNGGQWQTLAHSKDTGSKAFIHAHPGSDVQFRIQTPEGNTFRAGTTRNVDGLDHAKMQRTDNGYTLGFEDQRGNGDADFNDAVLSLRDPGRRH